MLLLTCRRVGVPPRQRKQVHLVRNDGVKRRRRSSDSALKTASAQIIVCCLALLCTVLVLSLYKPPAAAASAIRLQVEQSRVRTDEAGSWSLDPATGNRRENEEKLIYGCRAISGFRNSSGTRVRRWLLMRGEEEMRYG